jgi:hypothetical protein
MSISQRLKGLKMKITSRSKRAGAAAYEMTAARKAALMKAVKASAAARKGKKVAGSVKKAIGSATSSVRRATGKGTYSGRGATVEKKNSRAVGNYIRKMKK